MATTIILDRTVPREIQDLRDAVEIAKLNLARRAWQLAAVVPCTCGGEHLDDAHAKYCARRVRVEFLEGTLEY